MPDKFKTTKKYRFWVIVILLFGCVGLEYHFQKAHGITVVYTHLFYIPIVLAALWWGLKGGLPVSIFFGVIHILLSFPDVEEYVLFRSLLLVFVGLIIGIVSDMRKRADESLYRSRRDFEEIFQAIGQPAVILDPQHKVISANRAIAEISGLSEEELIGKKCFEVFHGTDRPPKGCPLEKMRVSGRFETEVMEVEALNRPFLVSCTPVKDSSGHLERIIHIATDMTTLKRAETALKESERFLAGIFESIQDGISVLNTDLTIRHVNHVIKQQFAEKIPLEGKKCYECYYNLDKPCEICPTTRCIESGKSEWDVLPLISGPRGKWIELFSYPLKDPDSGKVNGVVEFVRDITDRKLAEEALRQSEERYRGFFEASKDAVYITSKDGRIIDINESGLSLFGIKRDDLDKIDVANASYADPAERSVITGKIDRDGYALAREVNLKKMDGTVFPATITAVAIKDEEGNIAGYQGIVRDETEHKQVESQLQHALKMEAIGTLAGGIAHDFNNILSAILGYTELADQDLKEGEGAKAYLKEVLSAGVRAKDLVRQILAFSRQSIEEKKPIYISPVVKEALKLLRSSLPATIDIRQDIEIPTGQDTVLADPTRIHQVLMNLCTNAGHAMSEKGGVLNVSLSKVDVDSHLVAAGDMSIKPGTYLRLIIGDTGEGMTPNVMERIFDPYFTTKEKGMGTGMGLAVVHGIVESIGGAITVKSQQGKGSEFHVYFPVIEREVRQEPDKTEQPLPTGNECILFVDDERALADIGRQILERLGYKVVEMTDSIDALAIFLSEPDKFNLVVTDMTMPNMTGDKLAEKIMNIRPEIPIILCTGYSDYISKEKAREMGIRAFIIKPLVLKEFADIVRRVLDEQI